MLLFCSMGQHFIGAPTNPQLGMYRSTVLFHGVAFYRSTYQSSVRNELLFCCCSAPLGSILQEHPLVLSEECCATTTAVLFHGVAFYRSTLQSSVRNVVLPLLLFCSMGKHFIGALTSPRGEESRLFCSLSAVVSQIWNFCPGYMCVYSRLYTTHTHWKTGNQNLSDVFPPLTETLGDTPPPPAPIMGSCHGFQAAQAAQHATQAVKYTIQAVQHINQAVQHTSQAGAANHSGITEHHSGSTAHSGRCSTPLRQYSTLLRQMQHTTQTGAAHHLGRCSTPLILVQHTIQADAAHHSGRCSTPLRQIQHSIQAGAAHQSGRQVQHTTQAGAAHHSGR